MNQIRPEALKFLEEAKQSFESNKEYFTYIDKENQYIALRSGFREDCIVIYELSSEVGNFVEQLTPSHTVVVDYDELDELKKIKEKYNKLVDVTLNIIRNDEIGEELKLQYLESYVDKIKIV